ncbi:tetratricopeptide repeat protein [Paenibacillus polysaccharolyticus]|uniref:Tetratricopeptide repeat-containing protein n=1 Tax=Paenibacillus polysaccharolyticus TaxID=582692 RepID=A0A1G5KWU2_9BACL|nr:MULTISPECIES: tetratricopeptide repeat protein [Paenibacillus]MCP1134681.1 tetratricopeptide repeat protein [Paenibacillus polysaccharolyticus]MDP9698568.1 tetratricopeptide (TPR) repeat protein [Paenibacillus intestini]SCZ05086.1 Tetratricopeptide repeat-containing protein [Paenibacillus polysaccharolyticus]
MIIKFLIFGLLWQIVGNPFIAILILLVILYFLDRRFVGVFPSFTKPLKRLRNISRLKQQLALNPNEVSSKLELARLLIERKRYSEAHAFLLELERPYEQSAEYWEALGTTELYLGKISEGERHILHALEINPRVKYGQPYLNLATAFKDTDRDKALHYVQQFQEIHSSSSEAFYLLGSVYRSLGRNEDAKQAYDQSLNVYRSLPKYKKRQERRWAVRSWFRKRAL